MKHNPPQPTTLVLTEHSRPSWLSIVMALLITVSVSDAACHHNRPEPAQELTFAMGTNVEFARELVARYNASVATVRVVEKDIYGAFIIVSSLQHGESDLGIAQADAVYLAYQRGTQADPRPHSPLRGMAVLGVNPVQVIVRGDSSVHDVSSLRGKRIGILDPGTSSELVARFLLGAYGIGYADIEPVFQRFGKSLQDLELGSIDAAIYAAPPFHNPPYVSALKRMNARVLSLRPTVLRQLQGQHPFLRPVVVGAAEFWGQLDDVKTVGADALLVCRNSLSDEVVYQLTKEFFLALPRLADNYEDAAAIDPSLAAATPIPLHPGAARYYREREILR